MTVLAAVTQPGTHHARRIVVCQYDPRPHPLDDECVNVRDVVSEGPSLTAADRAADPR